MKRFILAALLLMFCDVAASAQNKSISPSIPATPPPAVPAWLDRRVRDEVAKF